MFESDNFQDFDEPLTDIDYVWIKKGFYENLPDDEWYTLVPKDRGKFTIDGSEVDNWYLFASDNEGCRMYLNESGELKNTYQVRKDRSEGKPSETYRAR